MHEPAFKGASKSSRSLLSPLERRLAAFALPRIPAWIETYHLTVLSGIWSAGIPYFGYLAAGDRRWLWATSVMIALQWITDFFDGKLGKFRDTGLVTWGFYVDHILDYAFLCALIVGYAFLLPADAQRWILALLAVTGGFMVHAFLAFAVTEQFSISHFGFGPTEFRIVLIVLNGFLVRHGPGPLLAAIPWVTVGAFIVLTGLAFRTHRLLWREDMARKHGKT